MHNCRVRIFIFFIFGNNKCFCYVQEIKYKKEKRKNILNVPYSNNTTSFTVLICTYSEPQNNNNIIINIICENYK